ncbi:hypothetical protein BC829DRAFT_448524 [Chytridium lagenaria]|nr:hypothetical protein BC829DRAFT_448524 [Chytridium lagenaria]
MSHLRRSSRNNVIRCLPTHLELDQDMSASDEDPNRVERDDEVASDEDELDYELAPDSDAEELRRAAFNGDNSNPTAAMLVSSSDNDPSAEPPEETLLELTRQDELAEDARITESLTVAEAGAQQQRYRQQQQINQAAPINGHYIIDRGSFGDYLSRKIDGAVLIYATYPEGRSARAYISPQFSQNIPDFNVDELKRLNDIYLIKQQHATVQRDIALRDTFLSLLHDNNSMRREMRANFAGLHKTLAELKSDFDKVAPMIDSALQERLDPVGQKIQSMADSLENNLSHMGDRINGMVNRDLDDDEQGTRKRGRTGVESTPKLHEVQQSRDLEDHLMITHKLRPMFLTFVSQFQSKEMLVEATASILSRKSGHPAAATVAPPTKTQKRREEGRYHTPTDIYRKNIVTVLAIKTKLSSKETEFLHRIKDFHGSYTSMMEALQADRELDFREKAQLTNKFEEINKEYLEAFSQNPPPPRAQINGVRVSETGKISILHNKANAEVKDEFRDTLSDTTEVDPKSNLKSTLTSASDVSEISTAVPTATKVKQVGFASKNPRDVGQPKDTSKSRAISRAKRDDSDDNDDYDPMSEENVNTVMEKEGANKKVVPAKTDGSPRESSEENVGDDEQSKKAKGKKKLTSKTKKSKVSPKSKGKKVEETEADYDSEAGQKGSSKHREYITMNDSMDILCQYARIAGIEKFEDQSRPQLWGSRQASSKKIFVKNLIT